MSTYPSTKGHLAKNWVTFCQKSGHAVLQLTVFRFATIKHP